MEKPAFEVINPMTGEAFRIWANGRTEGFEKHGATMVVNRIGRLCFGEWMDEKPALIPISD